jgi:hypothetical protein
MGGFAGLLLSLALSYQAHIAHHVSYSYNLIIYSSLAMFVLSAYKVNRTKPVTLSKSDNGARLAVAITLSSPSEGTEEEHLLRLSRQRVRAARKLNNNSSSSSGNLHALEVGGADGDVDDDEDDDEDEDMSDSDRLLKPSTAGVGLSSSNSGSSTTGKFVKDSFTGQLRRVDSKHNDLYSSLGSALGSSILSLTGGPGANSSSSSTGGSGAGGSSGYRSRARIHQMGPKLCGTCLADKRGCVKACITDSSLSKSMLYQYCFPSVDQKDGKKLAEAEQNKKKQKNNSSSSNSVSSVGKGGVAGSGAGSEDSMVITMATHCGFCNSCVVDVDHHCLYVG